VTRPLVESSSFCDTI